MTEAVIEEVCERIADGETIMQICRDDHMPNASTVYRLLGLDADFSNRYARAKEAQIERMADEIIDIADDGSNDWMERELENGKTITVLNGEHVQRSRVRIDTRKWLMSKLKPKKYGDKIELEHGGSMTQWIGPKPLTNAEWERKHGDGAPDVARGGGTAIGSSVSAGQSAADVNDAGD